MIESLVALTTHIDKFLTAERVELKRMTCGHYRLYIPVPPTFTKADASQCQAVLANLPVACNAFSAGGRINAVTVTDDMEGQPLTVSL